MHSCIHSIAFPIQSNPDCLDIIEMSRVLEELDPNVQGSESETTRPIGREKKKYDDPEEEEEEEAEENRYDLGVTRKGICFNSDDEEEESLHILKDQTPQHTVKWKDDTTSLHHEHTARLSNVNMSQLRKRRRSSARFLRMSANFNGDDLTEDRNVQLEGTHGKHEHLGDMYRQVIRMNAENKINAANSWGLKLIDNIDMFLEDDVPSNAQIVDIGTHTPFGHSSQRNDDHQELEKRINFTKASCTIDASVKIYSYRVDDVHLSSYKVLANLNRTDGKNIPCPDSDLTSDDQDFIQPIEDQEKKNTAPSQKKMKERHAIKTLEENIGMCTLRYIFVLYTE